MSLQYMATLQLLDRLKKGEVSLDDVYLTDSGWTLTPPNTNGQALRRPHLATVENASGTPEASGDE